ncbi:hypothetical protein ACFOUP_00700 [Belliella kenyensis]|uniref:Uncharacterized protein n=1 Tax=Belliella kenyensis TaxID=1472724 RepID=A0ABV8EFT4_9BACT|nr:hypothetical protein [Belliella kenyensis]MCH7401785.1 hypothetical protein [Belliella kenyensis]MDN3604284.1 hypothetical protein [Belliella kenyensis]
MENTAVAKLLKSKGQVIIKEGNGRMIQLTLPSNWKTNENEEMAVFLLFDLFQIRSLTEQFSEVSLDIVDFATKATIYQSPVNRVLNQGPVKEGKVKFSLIRNAFWNNILFAISQPVVFLEVKSGNFDFETKERFPLFGPDVKEIFLSPDGDVKIIKG